MKLRMAYCGMVQHEDRLLHAYQVVSPAGDVDPEQCQLYAEPLGTHQVGEIWDYETSADGAKVFKAKSSRVGMVADRALVASWLASHTALQTHESSWQKPMDPVLESLHPVRLAYRRLPEDQRAILLAQVVRYIVENPS